jgi:predicted nucleic acid-binding protein
MVLQPVISDVGKRFALLIAGQALRHGETLVTARREFSPAKVLARKEWAQGQTADKRWHEA